MQAQNGENPVPCIPWELRRVVGWPPMNELQDRIGFLLASLVREGRERGIQVAVYHRGELIVDAWAGVTDPSSVHAVDGETLFPVFSVTKGITATVIHRLIERGALDEGMRLAEVWPSLGRLGKERITLHHALEHTAGIPQMPGGIGFAELCDWRAICSAIERLDPLWPPGRHVCYHALTYGWLLGETACRVMGRSFPRLLREEVCEPLGLTGLFMGIPDAVEPRVAPITFVGDEFPDPTAEAPEAVPSWMWPLSGVMNRADVRRACLPGANGIMNARSLARHYAGLIPGGVDGVELMPPARVRAATRWRVPPDGPSKISGHRFALGYQVGGVPSVLGSRQSVFGHGGYGGSLGFADPEYRLAIGITKNLFTGGDSTQRIVDAVRDGLEVPA